MTFIKCCLCERSSVAEFKQWPHDQWWPVCQVDLDIIEKAKKDHALIQTRPLSISNEQERQ